MKRFSEIVIAIALGLGIASFLYIFFSDKIFCLIVFFVSIAFYFFIYKVVLFFSSKDYKITNRLVYIFSKSKPYIIESKDSIYEYKDMENMEFIRNCSIKAKSRMDCFEEKFRWSVPTSLNSMTIKASNPNHEIKNIQELNSWGKYSISFGHTFKRGEKIETGSIITNLKDPNHEAKTFFSYKITKKIKFLSLVVKIPTELNPKFGRYKIIDSYGDEIANEDLEYDNNIGGYKKDIPYPRRGFTYYIVWNF